MKRGVGSEWRTYEKQVAKLIQQHLPQARVRTNVKLPGRFSKRKRQIDILISEPSPGGQIKTIVDTKHYKRKVDVKAVDGLAGLVEDVGVDRGMLITNGGFTPGALKRAYYGPRNLELDILSFSDLQHLQGFVAIPYAGAQGFVVRAPMGWVVDAKRAEGRLATMYRRGLNERDAWAKREVLYINFWDRVTSPLTAAQLDAFQSKSLRRLGGVRMSRRDTIRRPDAVSRLRIVDVKSRGHLEVTGFLEFPEVIFFAVLHTRKETQGSNIRRLESVLQHAVPVHLKSDNTPLIAQLEARLARAKTAAEKSELLLEIGHWHRDMGDLVQARKKLEASVQLSPENYYALKEMIPVLSKLGDSLALEELVSKLLRLDPREPTAFADAQDVVGHGLSAADILRLIDAVKVEYGSDPLVQANCDFYAGQVLGPFSPKEAIKRLRDARREFKMLLDPKHHVFSALRVALKWYSRDRR